MKAESFFRLNYNAYTDLDNRERATARDKKKQRRRIFQSWQDKLGRYSALLVYTAERKVAGSIPVAGTILRTQGLKITEK